MSNRIAQSVRRVPTVFVIAAVAAGALCLPARAERVATSEHVISVTGELIVAVADDFPNNRAQRVYLLSDKRDGRTYQLEMTRPPRTTGRSGAVLTLRGIPRGSGKLLLDEASVRLLEASASTQQSTSTTTSSGNLATDARGSSIRRALVMVGKFNDVSVTCSSSDLDRALFSDPNGGSVNALYQETSLGQVGFSGTVTAPLAVNDTATGKCDLGPWMTALEAAARTTGLDPSDYQHLVYVVPRESSCSVGVGSVGGTPGRVWIERCDLADAFAHELGHNLGMNHSSTTTDSYGDKSDIMGYAGVGLRQVNAPHQEQMGWRSARQIATLTAGGTYDISPLELPETQALAPQVLKIAKPDTGDYYYLSYRRPLGFDGILNSTYFRLNVHQYAGGTARTNLLGLYDAGQSFVDSVNGITVTALSQTADYLTVQVQLGAATCTRADPVLSISPSSQTAAKGTPVSYVATVRNMDSSTCPGSTFSMTTGSLPSGWTAATNPASLTLAAGSTADATVVVTSATDAADGTYAFNGAAQDASLGRAASATAIYSVESSCVRAAPAVTLTPADQTGSAGETRNYTVGVSNRDSPTCTANTIELSGSIPAGWSGMLAAGSVVLAPAATTQTNLAVTSPSSAGADTYGISVRATDTVAGNAAVASGTYAVVSSSADTEAPSAPTGLAASVNSAKQRIGLAWYAATDNIGVAGYRVYRDGFRIGTTSGTSYTDGSVADILVHTYHVTAVDAAGNESVASASVTAALPARRNGRK